MKITNEKGVDVDDIIGPFDEDATLILVCIVTGGKKKKINLSYSFPGSQTSFNFNYDAINIESIEPPQFWSNYRA